jgi:hypothetical protein
MVLVLMRMARPLSAVEIGVVRMRVREMIVRSKDGLGCRFDRLDGSTLMKRRRRAQARQAAQHHRKRGEEPDSVPEGAGREHD